MLNAVLILTCQGTSAAAGLPEEDAAALQERSLKMRKAMGENLADDVAGESPDARTRRLNLIRRAPCLCWPGVQLQWRRDL